MESNVTAPARPALAAGMGAGRAMRTFLAAAFLLCLQPAHASMLGCEQKISDPAYCQNGVRRTVCMAGGAVVWADTRQPVTAGELGFLSSDGPVPKPQCAAPGAPAAAPTPGAPAPAAK